LDLGSLLPQIYFSIIERSNLIHIGSGSGSSSSSYKYPIFLRMESIFEMFSRQPAKESWNVLVDMKRSRRQKRARAREKSMLDGLSQLFLILFHRRILTGVYLFVFIIIINHL
jgi:hypothetical protein